MKVSAYQPSWLGSTRSDRILLALVTIVLSLMGGVPFYHPDFIVRDALKAIQTGGHPQIFVYPGLVIYLNALIYGCVYAVMYVLNLVQGPADFAALYERRTLITSPVHVPFFLFGHLLTVFFSVLGVLAVHAIIYRLTRARVFATIGGLFITTSFLWIANSHYITVDIPLAALAVTTVLMTVCVVQQEREPTLRQIGAIGGMIGLTASAKYNGGVIALAVIGALLFAYQNHKRWLQHCVVLGVVSAGVFVATNPFMFLDFPGFRKEFMYDLIHAGEGHPGFRTDQAWRFHMTTTLYTAYGWLPLLFALVGMGWIVATRHLKLAAKLAITLFPLSYYALMGSSALAFQRYMVPVIPFVALYAALALYALYSYGRIIGSSASSQLLAATLAVVALATMIPNAQHALVHNLLLTKQDTRAVLQQVINEARLEEPGSLIVAGRFTGHHFPQAHYINRFEDAHPEKANVITFDSFSKNVPTLARSVEQHIASVSIVVFDSFSHDELLYDSQIAVQLRPDVFLPSSVVQISPFRLTKEQVPFAPESMYSPYLPDLWDRAMPGPFIEIYVRDQATTQTIRRACNNRRAECVMLPSTEGYYYRKLARHELTSTSHAGDVGPSELGRQHLE